MAKRFTDTELWDKEWFMNLKPKIKCLVKYVRDKCDLAGVWSPNFKLASMYIGESVTEKDLLEIKGQFIKLNDGKIFCQGFIFFQYGEKLNPQSPVHKKILGILEKHNIDPNTLSNTLPNTLSNRVSNTLQEEEEDKEEEEEKEKEKEKDGAKIEVLNPFGKDFSAWQGWKDYKREELREGYRSPKTESTALKHLYKLARGNPETATAIIEQSIANRWKGLFEIKQQKNENGKLGTSAARTELAKTW